MGYKLYLTYLSHPCRAVVLFLLQNDIKFEETELNLLAGDQHSEEFLKINPAHKVPTLDDQGWILTESVVILRYLASKEKTPDHWYPADIKQRARVDEFLAWQHSTVSRYVGALFRILIGKWDLLNGRMDIYQPGESPDAEEMRQLISFVEMYLNHIENYFLKRTDFLAGNQISIADLIGLAELHQLAYTGYEVARNRPRLGAWLGRVRAVLGSNLDNVNKVIMELGNKYKREYIYE